MRKYVSRKAAAVIMAAAMVFSVGAASGYEVLAEEIQTEAAQTEAPQTEAPQTEAPQAEAPQTEAPQTEAPQTEAPQTEAPQTEAPQTEAPQTEAPQTEAPQTEAVQTEAPQTEAVQTEAPQTETAAQTETEKITEALTEAEANTIEETDAATEAEESETESETESFKTSFRYEDGEVVITATVAESAKLPERAQLKVQKLQPGSAAYEAAKQASMRDLGTDSDAEYAFYDVKFTVDGKEVQLADGEAAIQVQFKTVYVSEEAEIQSAIHIEETAAGTVARDVTANTGVGSAVSSVKFAF